MLSVGEIAAAGASDDDDDDDESKSIYSRQLSMPVRLQSISLYSSNFLTTLVAIVCQCYVCRSVVVAEIESFE